jgi:tetratricopeptide (TPR) repeat protein
MPTMLKLTMKHLRYFSGCLVLYMFFPQVQAEVPSIEIPMYGSEGKPRKLSEKDAAFIASIEKAGKTRQAVAKDVLLEAWGFYGQGDHKAAIRRFNQAWVLDPENGDAYHGFALISTVRDKNADAAEKFFRMAIAKPGVGPTVYVSYGRFLYIVNRHEEALTQLNKAISVSPKVRNARLHMALIYRKKGDTSQACDWARKAKANGDDEEPGLIEEMCKKGGTAAARPASLAANRPATAAIRANRKKRV